MLKEKITKFIFNPIVALIQSIIPIIFIELSLVSLLVLPKNLFVIFNIFINVIWIYSFIALYGVLLILYIA